jgi:hypothetical protein
MDELSPEMLRRLGEAMNYQNKLDYEDAGPKAPHGDIIYKGVALSSRYDALHEFAAMKRAVDAMPELMARRLDSIWCDSKAGVCYTVQIRPEFYLDDLPYVIEDAFKSLGGYNGLSIECEGRNIPYRDCYWPEYEGEVEAPFEPFREEDMKMDL